MKRIEYFRRFDGAGLLGMAAVLILAAALRLNLLDVPLERDEGEYAYAAQLIMDGMRPYEHLYSLKLPGVFLSYAGIMATFGETALAIRLGLLMLNALTAVFVFATARRLFGAAGGLAGAGAFVVLSAAPSVLGTFAHAEHFVMAPALAGFYLLLKHRDGGGNAFLIWAGLAFGVAFLMKQAGAAFMVFGACGVVLAGPGFRRESLGRFFMRELAFSMGAVLPYLLTCLWFAASGVFDRFWFWTVEYPRAYTALVPLDQAWTLFRDTALKILETAPLPWLLFAGGAVGLLRNSQMKAARPWLIAFLVFSFAAVLPGFYFRDHYFLLLMPAVAMIAGSAVAALQRLADRRLEGRRAATVLTGLLALVCIGHSVHVQRQFLFFMTPHEASRALFGLNPFPESLAIAQFIRTHTEPGERIAVLGSEPQIYFYSSRRAATGYIYMYPMMEGHAFANRMQDEFIAEIEAAAPRYLVFARIYTSWTQRTDSPPQLFHWMDRVNTDFTLVALADIHPQGTRYSWGPDIKWPPRSPAWIAVLQRNEGPRVEEPAQ